MSEEENSIYNPYYSPDVKAPVNDDWAAKRRVANELREMIETLVTSSAGAEVLDDLASGLSELGSKLSAATRIYGRAAYLDADESHKGTMASIGYELNPLDGICNPVAAPMKVWIEGDVAYGEANMGWQYEGPPNSVHGGFVAAIFDQFLGIAQKITHQPGVTGTLSIRYIKPTPLNTDLKLVGKVREVQGRKNILVGEMWAGDEMTASCEGLFIHIDIEKYKQMRDRKPA